MVALLDADRVNKLKHRDDGSHPKSLLTIQIRNIPYNEMGAIFPNGVALFEQPPNVFVMIGQFD